VDSTTLAGEIHLPSVRVQVLQLSLRTSQTHLLREDEAYRFDLSLDARLPGTQVRYCDHWRTHRYERAGKLFLLPPAETLQVRNGLGDQRAIVCFLSAASVADWLDDDLCWNDRRLEHSLDVGSREIALLMRRLGEEARNPGFASKVFCEAAAIQMAVFLERHLRAHVEAKSDGGLALWRLRLIDERLREVHEPPTLSDLAMLCGLSVRHLSRAFRVSRGIALGEHVARKRIENAKRLLATSGSVKATAYSMGFASPSGFIYAFHQATGMTPGQYRSLLKTGQVTAASS
jgi:AraC family transcriptional regulator